MSNDKSQWVEITEDGARILRGSRVRKEGEIAINVPEAVTALEYITVRDEAYYADNPYKLFVHADDITPDPRLKVLVEKTGVPLHEARGILAEMDGAKGGQA